MARTIPRVATGNNRRSSYSEDANKYGGKTAAQTENARSVCWKGRQKIPQTVSSFLFALEKTNIFHYYLVVLTIKLLFRIDFKT